MLRLFAVLVLFAAPARAQGSADEEARANFEAGRVAFADARFDDALPYFERAYALSQRPELLYNIGLCHDRLGHDAEALAAFQGYLEAIPEAENRAEVEQRIRTARERATRGASSSPTPGTDPTGWILLGVGGAVAIGGGVLLGVGQADASAISGSSGTLSWTAASAGMDQANVLTGVGIGALAAGIALAGVGIALGVSASSGAEASVALRLGPSGIHVSGVF
jgi:tetratricopeptide (TPR) repeat protein